MAQVIEADSLVLITVSWTLATWKNVKVDYSKTMWQHPCKNFQCHHVAVGNNF